jgi:predicted GNAT family acetyltransferase
MDDDTEMEPYIPKREEDPLRYSPPERKTVKRYATCQRATKGLIRCIDMQRYAMKIGPECVSFCMRHIVESISKVIRTILEKLWYIDYWDNISHRWERQQVANDHEELGFHFESREGKSLFTIVAFADEDGNIDFEEPFIGSAFDGTGIESDNMDNIVAHFLQRYELQPLTMWFQANPKQWNEIDIQRRFTFEDENGELEIDANIASHIICGNTKIPARVELDSAEEEDGMDYWFNIYVPMDFTRL